MRVAIIGTFPPTRCGIATFTADVEMALAEVGVEVEVVVVDPDPSRPNGATPTICSTDRGSYAAAAEWLNRAPIDLVLVQHEFGIHGGESGAHLLDLTQRLTKPYVVTLHTVLPQLSATQSAVLEAMCNRAAAVTVFTPTARRMVLEQELAPSHTVVVVPHGAPIELYRPAGDALRTELGLDADAKVLSTFGLLSPGKGIEVALRAMPQIVAGMPEVRYVIAGRTHPGVQRTGGEQYRTELLDLVHELGIEPYVRFVDRFLTVDEIAELLSVTRVFITPYRNIDQIVSGALTFAIAAGCPVVSTPYRYARDMIGDGAGTLVPFDDPSALAGAVLTLAADGAGRERALAAASHVSAQLSWPAIGRTLRNVLVAAGERAQATRRPDASSTESRTDHLRALIDDTGVLQHAEHHIPRHEEGYCVDDAARLLPIAARLAKGEDADPRWAEAVRRMLAYLRSSSLGGEGLMRNFMTWDRRWLDEPHDGDHVGRAIWGLGELLHEQVSSEEATFLLQQLLARPIRRPWRRLVAYRALGVLAAADHLDIERPLDEVHRLVRDWTFDTSMTEWIWPEPRVVYDAPRVPEVMMRLGMRLGDDKLTDRGLECFTWLEQQCRVGDWYRFVGHRGLGRNDDIHHSGDEQPLEAAAMIDAAVAFYQATGDSWALAVAERAWSWFLGNNRLGITLGSLQTGACRDALIANGVNPNCGAESTISFHRGAGAIGRLRRLFVDGAGPCSNATTTTH